MLFVSYLRVSTVRQGHSGLGVDAQRSAVAGFIAGRSGELTAEFVEVESGRKNDRPQLASALDLCRRKRAVLVIAKLDRLARNVAFVSRLMESGAEFVAVDNPHANKLMVHMLAAFAEHERDQISARTKAALAVAKARGVRLGNPRIESAKASAIASEQAARFRAGVAGMARALKDEGRTLQAVAEELNARGVRTARGRSWYPSTISNVLRD